MAAALPEIVVAALDEEEHQSVLKARWAKLWGHRGDPVVHKKTSVLILHWEKGFCDFDVSEEVCCLTLTVLNWPG